MGMLFIGFLIIFCLFPFIRCAVFNAHNVMIYGVKDIYRYFRDKKWNTFNYYGIDLFIGMFGHGKTLSMTHKARQIYKQFGNKVRFISNYKLQDIPYIPLTNFNQIVEIGEEQDTRFIGTVVLIDEIEDVLSHRNYANFPLAMLHSLTQQRKLHLYICASAQRFFMVDKIFRSITTHVIDCHKLWRFQNMRYYDAWDYEQAMNPQLVRRMANLWWFVKDSDYAGYDTTQMISKDSAENFISNDEAIVRKGLDAMSNIEAIKHPSKSLQKRRNNSHKRR